MASSVQIVPRFLHSHVETYINDYTFYDDYTAVESDDSVKFLAVFTGPKGISNTLVKIQDTDTFREMFGQSNYNLYGQPLMMPIAELATGNASVWAMRIMPDDAKYANAALSAYYKADVENKKFYIKYKAKSFTGDSAITDKNDLIVKGKILDGEPNVQEVDGEGNPVTDETGNPVMTGAYQDAAGFTQVPFMTFRAIGSGAYGNSMRWRIARSKDYEAGYEVKVYSYEALSATNGISTLATYAGALVDSGKYKESLMINDIIDAAPTGKPPMDIYLYEDGFETLYEAYVKFLGDVATANPDETIVVPDEDTFDPFFGYALATDDVDPYITIVTGPSTEVDDEGNPVTDGTDPYDQATDTDENGNSTILIIDNPEGNTMAGGDDGAFSSGDAASRDEAIATAYSDAFSGKLDPVILANKRCHFDAILDANYPYEAKEKLAELALTRDDCLLFLDCGFITSFSKANQQSLLDDYGKFNSRTISKNPQWYVVRDPDTRKKTKVTITYYFAQNYATHIKENGNHVPFVNTYALLTGHVKDSLQPIVEEYETDLKEWLYVNRFNYFEAVGENRFLRSCQNTAQMGNSDLMEESNMAVLYELKHILEVDARERLYNFANADDRKRFTDYETAKFAPWVGRKLFSFDIVFDMNEWEAERSILHCYVAIQFRTLAKRTIIEIDVNKRDFTA